MHPRKILVRINDWSTKLELVHTKNLRGCTPAFLALFTELSRNARNTQQHSLKLEKPLCVIGELSAVGLIYKAAVMICDTRYLTWLRWLGRKV